MFSEKYAKEIEEKFEKQLELLECRREEIIQQLAQCSEDEAQALRFLYTAMPVSDAIDYPASVYYTFAKHGAYLWNEGQFKGKVPEKIFANYVLHHRVNNEDISDHRGFFYDKLKDVIAGKNMYDSVIEANYWCAAEGNYHTTDGRTESPITMYNSATGRCGEESTFAVSVFRALGIPARQVYVPLWSHCDDNHAWVEAWCDGKWYFLGACEPEEALNRGWFAAASTRAMLVHSRWFGQDEPEDEIVGKSGMSRILNHLDIYAQTIDMKVKVTRPDGSVAAGEKVYFEVLNYSGFGTVAVITADEEGIALIKTGHGSLRVCAGGNDYYGEILVKAGEQECYELKLSDRTSALKMDEWVDLTVYAPEDTADSSCDITEAQKERGADRTKQAAAYREAKIKAFYREEECRELVKELPVDEQEKWLDIFKRSMGNLDEIIKFFKADTHGKYSQWYKLAILESIREKDYWDTSSELLEDNCEEAAIYGNQLDMADDKEKQFFTDYILCPRVSYEMLVPFRKEIAQLLTTEEKESIVASPQCLPELIDKKIVTRKDLEYGGLITSAAGALRGKIASAHSKQVLCVQIYRTLGIPARLNPMDHVLEYYCDGEFHALGKKIEKRDSTIVIVDDKDRKDKKELSYYLDWSLSKYDDGIFQMLEMDEDTEESGGEEFIMPAVPGIYRLITKNRLTNGNQLAREYTFEVRSGETKRVTLSMRESSIEDMLDKKAVKDMPLYDIKQSKENMLSELVKAGKTLFIWLEESREPSEHILNELFDAREEFTLLADKVKFIVKDEKALENVTIKRTITALPKASLLKDSFTENYEELARTLYLEPGKLPLIAVIDEKCDCIYSVAGYNVGTAGMLLKIM